MSEYNIIISTSEIRRNQLITQALYYSKDMETFATGLLTMQLPKSEQLNIASLYALFL